MGWTLFWQIIMIIGWTTLCLAGLQPSTKPKKEKEKA